MKTISKLGIWMDHSNAFIMDFTSGEIVNNNITSAISEADKSTNQDKNEVSIHNKEQNQHASYYKEIGETIRNFDEVVLFGPTQAKNELFNILRGNHLFEAIKIDVEDTDNMTEGQMHAFIRDHFAK